MHRHSPAKYFSTLIPRLILCIFLIMGLVCSSFSAALAQHEIDPETWIEMRKMFRKKGPTPTIEEDIAALAGPEAKRAGPRLIDRGPEALPAVHQALRTPEIEPRHAQRLLQVLRSIGNESSVTVVLELLEQDDKFLLRRDALLVLALLPSTEDAAAFIINLAQDVNEKWNTYRMAYTWFGMHRDPRGRTYAEKILADPDPEKQTVGLYVLARLGDAKVLEPITQLLIAPPANSRDTLMFALAEITTPEEFKQRAPSSLAWSHGYKEALLYTQFKDSAPEEKAQICRKMLRSMTPGYRELAVRYLLENGHAKDLRPYAATSFEVPGLDAIIRNDIRKAGWKIIDTEDKFDIVPTDTSKSQP